MTLRELALIPSKFCLADFTENEFSVEDHDLTETSGYGPLDIAAAIFRTVLGEKGEEGGQKPANKLREMYGEEDLGWMVHLWSDPLLCVLVTQSQGFPFLLVMLG